MITVAALYIDPRGPYPSMPGVECWDEQRDARNYAGPHPVVAHPPCQLWTNLARVNFKRYGGERNRPGNDGGCFAAALAAVRGWGGVLEHPAGSHAWKAHGLQEPLYTHGARGWRGHSPAGGGSWEAVCEVWQSAYGHKARKRTWLLYCGARPPFELDWRREPGTHQVGWFDRAKPTVSKAEASRTPAIFAEMLVALARHCRADRPTTPATAGSTPRE